MDSIGQDALDEKYRFGYSFKNPRLVKPITEAKPYPWFKMKWAPEGPTQKKEQLHKSGKLSRYPAVWRRAAKSMHKSRLGDISRRTELPDYQEVGQLPGPTEKETAVERGFWGSLSNVLTKTSDVLVAREQSKIAQAQAEIAARTPMTTIVETAQSYWPLMILGGAGVIGIYLFTRRK